VKYFNIPEWCETLDDCETEVAECLVEKIKAETLHGERGPSVVAGHYKFQGNTYVTGVEIDWNRYDKQYYYVDGYSIIKSTPIELTPEQKGAVECLWDVFGGKVNDKGYKVLNERIGVIYGDSITQSIAYDIMERLKQKGFASSNITYGLGSFSMTYSTRDSLGIAQKATWAKVDGVGYELFKDPITDGDRGMKKSAKGLLRVDLVDGEYVLKDQCTPEEEQGGELDVVFENGRLVVDWTLNDIRERVSKSN